MGYMNNETPNFPREKLLPATQAMSVPILLSAVSNLDGEGSCLGRISWQAYRTVNKIWIKTYKNCQVYETHWNHYVDKVVFLQKNIWIRLDDVGHLGHHMQSFLKSMKPMRTETSEKKKKKLRTSQWSFASTLLVCRLGPACFHPSHPDKLMFFKRVA